MIYRKSASHMGQEPITDAITYVGDCTLIGASAICCTCRAQDKVTNPGQSSKR